MIDYSIFHRRTFGLQDLSNFKWDTLLSAYNHSARVQTIMQQASARNKHWIIHHEYGFAMNDRPDFGKVFCPSSVGEAEFIGEYINEAWDEISTGRLCVDITGFMRPHLMFLVKRLGDLGIRSFDAIYTDPVSYVKSENTQFALGVSDVRQVAGYEGVHVPDRRSSDLLVISAGFDHQLVKEVAENKRRSRKILMFGLPSLQPDMYQQNRLQVMSAANAVGPGADEDCIFAPANNPFATAEELQNTVSSISVTANLYLSPLGTKAQVLGFALYYLGDCINTASSIIFPFSSGYERETSIGLSRISLYSVELV